MKCPECQQNMIEKWDAVTNNGKSGKQYKEYNKIVYWCSKDDIWIGVETPKHKHKLREKTNLLKSLVNTH